MPAGRRAKLAIEKPRKCSCLDNSKLQNNVNCKFTRCLIKY